MPSSAYAHTQRHTHTPYSSPTSLHSSLAISRHQRERSQTEVIRDLTIRRDCSKKFQAAVCNLVQLYPRTLPMYTYGTAGFRFPAKDLSSCMLRMGILAVLRSRSLQGATIGIMITASHNSERDNGLKLVDPHGDMLDMKWEPLATKLCNAAEEDVWAVIVSIMRSQDIAWDAPASVFVGRDTRLSSPRLASLVRDGIRSIGGKLYDYGIVTTPQLHYMVNTYNRRYPDAKTAGSPPELSQYYDELSDAFLELTMDCCNGDDVEDFRDDAVPKLTPVTVDCANGVGYVSLLEFAKRIASRIDISAVNYSISEAAGETDNTMETDEAIAASKLNNGCGAEFVQKQKELPSNVTAEHAASIDMKFASFDGDADRLVYYYVDGATEQLCLLDGDRLIVLYARYLVDLLRQSKLDTSLSVGIVQTAYANGGATRYIQDELAITVQCAKTGVKHVHHKAAEYDIGVYFEANGHGTVLFSSTAVAAFQATSVDTSRDAIQRRAARQLYAASRLLNQCVGDAASDLLFAEVVMQRYYKSRPEGWYALYKDLPSRMLKVSVADRTQVITSDAERRCDAPEGLQERINELIAAKGDGVNRRSFVRPSGTEDVVRVYAEATTQTEADDLAESVSRAVEAYCNNVI